MPVPPYRVRLSTPEPTRKFHFLREIASGGFGSVFLAKVIHPDGFSRIAAIKLLHPKWSENEEVASRMRDEARLLGQLRHRNIVDVDDLTMIDGRVAVIMEYLEAVDLRTIIKDCVARGELLPTRAAVEITTAVASALDAAYNRPPFPGEKPLRVIHRDIKPSNVMIDEAGTPKVLDFGVARADFDERESHTKEVAFGSLEYMPPERLFFEPESPASDVYSLGATLFELLALERFGKGKLRPNQHEELIFKRLRYLFSRNPIGSADVRDELKALLSDMLAFDEADRPQAAQAADRMRSLARRLRNEDTLPEWAERNVPRLLQAQRDGELDRPPNPLVDQVLTEDSQGFRRTPTDELFSDKTIPPPDDEFGLDAPAPEDERRWRALKEATLAEIGASSEPPPLPPSLRSINPAAARAGDIATAGGPVPRGHAPPRKPAPPRGPAPQERPQRAAPSSAGRPRGARQPAAAPPRQGRTGLVLLVAGATMLVFGLAVVAAAVVVLVVEQEGLLGPEPLAGIEAAPSASPQTEAQAAPDAGGEKATATAASAPKAAPEAAPESAPKPAPAAVPPGPHVTFVSHMAKAKKLMVRCDGGSGSGQGKVVLGAKGLGNCLITGLGTDRSRLTAVVKDVREGTYVCFEGETNTCQPRRPGQG